MPHASSVLGYFERLQTSELVTFRGILLEIDASPSSFFSFVERSYCSFTFYVITETMSFNAERDDPSELGDLVGALGKEWQQASVTVSHGTKSPNLALKHIGAYKNEQLTASFNNVSGICQITASFREGYDTSAYLLRLANALSLAEKPKKASRHIPEWLETKLLCDSMHLCNLCRETGVIIHHIVPIEEGGPSEEENLIVLCLNHHNQAHSKSILSRSLRAEHLREYKRRHFAWVAARGSGMPLESAKSSSETGSTLPKE